VEPSTQTGRPAVGFRRRDKTTWLSESPAAMAILVRGAKDLDGIGVAILFRIEAPELAMGAMAAAKSIVRIAEFACASVNWRRLLMRHPFFIRIDHPVHPLHIEHIRADGRDALA